MQISLNATKIKNCDKYNRVNGFFAVFVDNVSEF